MGKFGLGLVERLFAKKFANKLDRCGWSVRAVQVTSTGYQYRSLVQVTNADDKYRDWINENS